MHENELYLDEALVRRLIRGQFQAWAELPVRRIEPSGTDNAIFRLGDELSARLPRIDGPTLPGSVELDWLPRVAPELPVEVPVPVAQGWPGEGYPWFWEIHTWVDGATVPVEDIEDIDAVEAARDLAALVGELQRVDPVGASARDMQTISLEDALHLTLLYRRKPELSNGPPRGGSPGTRRRRTALSSRTSNSSQASSVVSRRSGRAARRSPRLRRSQLQMGSVSLLSYESRLVRRSGQRRGCAPHLRLTIPAGSVTSRLTLTAWRCRPATQGCLGGGRYVARRG